MDKNLSLKPFYRPGEARKVLYGRTHPASKIFAIVSLQEHTLSSPARLNRNATRLLDELEAISNDGRRNTQVSHVAYDARKTLVNALGDARRSPSATAPVAPEPQP